MSGESCERCGDDFRVELCVVGRPSGGIDRNRIEAYLCYPCRNDTPHERLGVTGGGQP